MNESTKTVPLLEQVAAALREQGEINRNLTASELAEVMKSVVDGLVSSQAKVEAAITSMGVRIENQRGMVDCSVQVSKPINASIDLNLTLGNEQGNQPQNKTRLALVGLTVNERAGMAAKFALKAVNLKGRATLILKDPNAGLFGAFEKELSKRGVALTGMQLQFTPKNILSVGLQGRPVQVVSRYK